MIDAVIAQVCKSLTPSSGDDLQGFLIDTDTFFRRQDLFATVELLHESSPESLVNVRLQLSGDAPSLQAVSIALKDTWKALGYRYFQATSMAWRADAMVLRFVTVIAADSFYVTGTVKVSGQRYSALASHLQE